MKTTTLIALTALLACSCNNKPDYDATGIFEATTVTLSAETSGKILSLDVAEGDTITAGATVAVIDTALLSLQQMQLGLQQQSATASVPDIAAQVAAIKSQIAHQQQEVARQESLLADGATTRKAYDDASAQLRTLNRQLEAQLSTLGKNQTSISDNAMAIFYQQQQIAEQISKSTIKAPITGTVLVKYAEPGEFAMPGKVLVKVADMNKIYLRSYFTANQLAHIHLGMDVKVIADFGGEEQYEYPGKITWIAEESEFTPKSIQTRDSRANLVYAVKIAVENDGRLKLGQYGEVVL